MPTKDNFFRTPDGAHIFYEVNGEGTPVVLLHGVFLSSKVFYKNVPELAKSFKVITADYRGFGYSSKCLQGHSVDQYATDIYNLLQHLNIGKFVLCGWSLSVTIVLRYIEMFGQDDLLGVVLLDGSCSPFSTEPWNAHVLSGYNMEGLADKFRKLMDDPAGSARRNAEGWFKDKDGNLEEIAVFTREGLKAPVWSTYAIYYDYMMTETSQVLASLQVPVMIMTPASNKLRAEHESSLAPKGQMRLFDAAHAFFCELPDEFNQAFSDFLHAVEQG